eukprot:5156292-Pleurochrysis_carterae.AAC.1
MVDLGNSLGDGALINAYVGEAQRGPLAVVIDVGQASAWSLTVALKDSPSSSATADGGGVSPLKNRRVGEMPAYKAKELLSSNCRCVRSRCTTCPLLE